MKERTREYLATAERHRTAAQFLVHSSTIEPTVREWAVIAAFYAAVHYVNGFLWERLGLEPADHRERSEMISRLAELRPLRTEYTHLRDAAYVLRYRPGLRTHDDRVQDRLHDLSVIEVTILAALNRA